MSLLPLLAVVIVASYLVTVRAAATFVLPIPSATATTWLSSTKQTDETTSPTPTEHQRRRPDLPDYGKTSIEIDKIRIDEEKAGRWRRRDLFGTTLIEQTQREMENDAAFQDVQKRYDELGPAKMTAQERKQRRRALDKAGIPAFPTFLEEKVGTSTIRRKEPTLLQINVGLYCNQACGHCHVESSPLRKDEMMTADVAAQCVKLLKATPSIKTLDITGGAPELNDNFRYLVTMARSMCDDNGDDEELEIIDRCNLTVLQEPGQEDLLDFLKENRVRIVASLPCYSRDNVDRQRGNGVFERSIAALLALNDAGYGVPGSGLILDLVYNPAGAFLPPEQGKLERQYKKVLHDDFGILFNQLYTMTNMPIKRFADYLHRRGELEDYMDLLARNFNADTVNSLMCLDTVSIGYDGRIFDCDFNQQLGYDILTTTTTAPTDQRPQSASIRSANGGLSVFDVDDFTQLRDYTIRMDNHCFGCTAGMGSS